MSNNTEINQLLRELRNKNNRTLESLAEELDVSRQTISNWESGKAAPDGASLIKFLKAYDPTLGEFKKLISEEKDGRNSSLEYRRELCRKCRERTKNFYKDCKGVRRETCEGEYSIYSFNLLKCIDYFNEIVSSHLPDVTKIIGLYLSPEEEQEKQNCVSVLLRLAVENSNYDLGYPISVLELLLRLKHEGYLILESNLAQVFPPIDNFKLLTASEEQRERLGQIFLEHSLLEEDRTNGLSVPESLAIKQIRDELNQIQTKFDDIMDKKIIPLAPPAEDDIAKIKKQIAAK